MALSVSSERAFSSVGITICKWRNCLDADIVESLQCLIEVVDVDDGLSWGAVSDDGNGIVEVCGNDTDIDIE